MERALLETYPGGKWKVKRPLNILGYTVPVDFITDLASIPRLVRPLIPVNTKHREASILHDWLYKNAKLLGLTRKQCDGIYYTAMKLYGVNVIRRQMIHKGLLVGGWWSWLNHRKND